MSNNKYVQNNTCWKHQKVEAVEDWCPVCVINELEALRAENSKLRNERELILEVGEMLNEYLYAPESNCSCHISPPCRDCVDYSEVRELKSTWNRLKEKLNGK